MTTKRHHRPNHKNQENRPQKPEVWKRPGWRGPRVETRPENASAEWPEGAVERVMFTREAFEGRASRLTLESLPFTEYFGADGWPLRTPELVKPRLDLRMKAELHRFPWTCWPETWDEARWLREATDYDWLMRLVEESKLFAALEPVLPAPVVYGDDDPEEWLEDDD